MKLALFAIAVAWWLGSGCAPRTPALEMEAAPAEPTPSGPLSTDAAQHFARLVAPEAVRHPDWDLLGLHAFYQLQADGAPQLLLVDETGVESIRGQEDLEGFLSRRGVGRGEVILNQRLFFELFFTWVYDGRRAPVELLDPDADSLFGPYAIESGCVTSGEIDAPSLEVSNHGALYRYWVYRVRERDCRRFDVMVSPGGQILYTSSPSGVAPMEPPETRAPHARTTVAARSRLAAWLVSRGLSPSSFEIEREPGLDLPVAWAFSVAPSEVRSLRDDGVTWFVTEDDVLEVSDSGGLEQLLERLEADRRPLNHKLFFSLYLRFDYREPSVRVGGGGAPRFPEQLDASCLADPAIAPPRLEIDDSGAEYRHWIYRLRMQDCVRFDVQLSADGGYRRELSWPGD